MRKIFTVLALVIIFSLNAENISLKDGYFTGYKILSSSTDNFELEFGLNELSLVNIVTEKGEFAELGFNNSKNTNLTGSPKLPIFRELIEFPNGSNPEISIISVKETEIFLSNYQINNKIIPSQPSYSKSTPSSEIKFIIKPELYSIDSYTERHIATITKSGTMRGVDIGVLEINPVSYNPVKNSLKIITDVKLNVTFSGVKANSEQVKAENYSPYFENQFSKLINHTPLTSKSDLTQYPITYLIVANEILNGNAKLQEFIDWKTEKGFKVVAQYFASTATTADVDSWIETQYQNLSPKPSFLLIVGDQSGTYIIPTEQNPALGSAGNVSVSDLLYSVIGTTSASNRIPSIYVGRFSVNNQADLDAQVDKTLWYEKTQFTSGADLTYLSKVMGVAGYDSSYGATYGNPQIRYGMSYYFNDNYRIPIDGSGVHITGIPYYCPASASSDAAVVAEVSSGVAFYNYTAHGYNGGFADPTFTISNVDNLTNTGMYPLIVGNCCLTGSFRDTECFGESWLNAPNKGAVGFIGASMSTYWDEDLAMGIGEVVTGDITPPYTPDDQGMYDGLMNMDYSTQGGIRFAGLLAVEEENTYYTSSYWSSYHLFGDPSLMIYMGIPGDNTVSHASYITSGDSFFTVQTKKGSYVAITDDDGVLHGAAVADESGYAVVTLDVFLPGNANIVVTSQFKKPYFASIPVVSPDGPYLLINDYLISTEYFGTSGTIDLELKNIGVSASEGITATASTLSEYLSFTDYQENYSNIAEKDSLNKSSAFSFNISPSTPDQQEIRIDLAISDTSKDTYYSHILLKVKSPDLNYSYAYDGDIIYPGDNKDITITVSNTGTADINNITAVLSETSDALVTISEQQEIPSIASGESVNLIFSVDFSSDIQNGTGLDFSLDLTATNGYENSYLFDINVGMTENFETGDFSENPWYFEGNGEWSIDNTVYYSGTNSAKSGIIIDNQSTSMKVDFMFVEDGTISFYKKTSSESGYDKLTFYLDGIAKGNWSGESTWSYQSYPVSAGIHTFTWMYAKDGSMATGLDCAWVDNILATNAYSGIEEELAVVPEKPMLYKNYPNPFNPSTTIKFSVPSAQNVELNVFNSNGQLIRNLVNNKMEKGFHSVNFSADDLISGIYFYTLKANGSKYTQKMLLIK